MKEKEVVTVGCEDGKNAGINAPSRQIGGVFPEEISGRV
jgi:hypothetical protein